MNLLRVDFQSLRLLLAVAQTGSITQAAQQCHLALGAASTRLRELEERLGTALLVRQARGTVLTEAGERVVRRARVIERELAQLGLELQDLKNGAAGHVRVVANMSSIAAVLPADLTDFLKTHPGVQIDLSEQTSRDIQSLVADGQADIGILTSPSFRQGLQADRYYQDELVVTVPDTTAWRKTKALSAAALLQHDMILLQEGGAIAEWLADLARAEGVILRVRVRAKGFDALAQLVSAGLGITVLPQRVAERFSKVLRLRSLRLQHPEAQRVVSICTRSGGPVLPSEGPAPRAPIAPPTEGVREGRAGA